jgi:hypothetical protein
MIAGPHEHCCLCVVHRDYSQINDSVEPIVSFVQRLDCFLRCHQIATMARAMQSYGQLSRNRSMQPLLGLRQSLIEGRSEQLSKFVLVRQGAPGISARSAGRQQTRAVAKRALLAASSQPTISECVRSRDVSRLRRRGPCPPFGTALCSASLSPNLELRSPARPSLGIRSAPHLSGRDTVPPTRMSPTFAFNGVEPAKASGVAHTNFFFRSLQQCSAGLLARPSQAACLQLMEKQPRGWPAVLFGPGKHSRHWPA